jgi:hypothetical protein
MAIVYLKFDSSIDLEPSNDSAKKSKEKLGPENWTVVDFLLGKTALRVYHNEFVLGSHYVEGGAKRKYVISGVVKMTVKPKLADILLTGDTEWVVTEVKSSSEDGAAPLDLVFSPKSGAIVLVSASLEKPSVK